MRSATKSRKTRLTRWEILGAWLHVWTAPKDLDVPPVPWGKVALYGAATAILVAVAALLIIPPLNEGKRKGEAQRARDEAAAIAKERARLVADQKVHRLVIPAGTPLVAAMEAGIKADAQARVKAKKLGGPILSAACEQAGPNSIRFADSVVYKCFVKTATGLQGQGQDILGAGYPFVGTVYGKKRTVAWCKQNPPADEKGRRGATHVRVSPVCAGKLSAVL